MSTPKKVFDLTAHCDPVAGIIKVKDISYDVLKFNGLQYQQVQLMSNNTPVSEMYDLVAAVVPSLPDSERMTFDRDMCGLVLMMAGQGVEAVERLFPNAPSPETSTSLG